jgi:hypothetical protein
MINLHERVVLTVSISAEGLEPGDVGTVVHLYSGGGMEVEFFTLKGKTAAVVTLNSEQVRPLSSRDIIHAREISEK